MHYRLTGPLEVGMSGAVDEAYLTSTVTAHRGGPVIRWKHAQVGGFRQHGVPRESARHFRLRPG